MPAFQAVPAASRDIATAERRIRRALLSRWRRLVPLVVMPLVLAVVGWGNLWPEDVPDLLKRAAAHYDWAMQPRGTAVK